MMKVVKVRSFLRRYPGRKTRVLVRAHERVYKEKEDGDK